MYTSATKSSLSSPGLTAPQTGNGVMPPLHVELERVAETIASRSALPLPQLRFVNARSVPTEELVDAVALVENPLPRETIAWLAHGARAVLDTESPRTVLVPAVAALVRDRSGAEVGVDDLQSRAPAMRRLLADARRVAGSNASVLITGATGVGKEHLARALHAAGPRAERPFLVVNCGALPENLLESQLFGHERGAFTGADRRHQGFFEAADGGTLLLDEIGEMPQHLQVKLLTVLENREVVRIGSTRPVPVDVRLIAATNRGIEEEVRRGTFRSDLYYRLNVVHLEVPRLAERREDLPQLCGSYLRQLTTARQRPFGGIEPATVEALLAHDWPGNVRELHNVLEHAALMAENRPIAPAHLPATLLTSAASAAQPTPGAAAVGTNAGGVSFDLDAYEGRTLRDVRDQAVAAVERAFLVRLLERTRGRIAETAELAGLRPRSLYDKMRQLDLRKETFRRRSR